MPSGVFHAPFASGHPHENSPELPASELAVVGEVGSFPQKVPYETLGSFLTPPLGDIFEVNSSNMSTTD